MAHALGEKIGEGATADVHAWAPGRIVKVFKVGVPRRVSVHEARMTRAVFAAGASAPELFGEISVDGRPGLVMSRLDGPSLLAATKAHALTFEEAGAILADCLCAVHATPPPSDVPLLSDAVMRSLKHARGALPDAVSSGIIARLAQLPPGSGLCHGDPNPGNVITTADGTKLIDWITAVRASPAFDLASAHVMLTELAPLVADDPERPHATNAALQVAYARLVKTSPGDLAAQVQPYLPIVRSLALLGGALPALASKLLSSLRADFPG